MNSVQIGAGTRQRTLGFFMENMNHNDISSHCTISTATPFKKVVKKIVYGSNFPVNLRHETSHNIYLSAQQHERKPKQRR